MDKTLRNTLIAIIGSIVIALGGAWIQLNSRIAVLEVQVQNDHQQIAETKNSIDEMKNMLQNIQVGVQHLNDVKEDKK